MLIKHQVDKTSTWQNVALMKCHLAKCLVDETTWRRLLHQNLWSGRKLWNGLKLHFRNGWSHNISSTRQQISRQIFQLSNRRNNQGILKGDYHCTIDLLFDWFGISFMITDIFLFLFVKQTNSTQSNRRSTVQWYFPH